MLQLRLVMRQRDSRYRAVYVDVERADVRAGRRLLEEVGFEVEEAVARTAAEVIEAGGGAAALLVGDSPITREVLDALATVRIVAAGTVGVDHIDVAEARRRGVWVSNVPAVAVEEVAVHALAMALCLVRHLSEWDRAVRAGRWDIEAVGPIRRPSAMTLGIVGLGRIGRRLAQVAAPVFGRLVGCDPYLGPGEWPPGVEAVNDVDVVFETSDVVSLHVPLRPDTELLVDAERLGRMRTGSYFVNVARGRLVDAAALLEALDEGRLAGAALDVLPDEPPDPCDRLLEHPRVLLSPHVAFVSDEARRAYIVRQAENVVAWLATGRPVDPVAETATA